MKCNVSPSVFTPSVRKYQLRSRWVDFLLNSLLKIWLKYCEEIKIFPILGKNKNYFA